CIRYRGADPEIARRIVEMGQAELCDQPVATDAKPLVRTHVSFALSDKDALVRPRQIAAAFLHYFRNRPRGGSSDKVREVHSDDAQSVVEISWFEDVFHRVAVERLSGTKWHVQAIPCRPAVAVGLSRLVERWLRDDGRFHDIQWFSDAQWRSGGPG